MKNSEYVLSEILRDPSSIHWHIVPLFVLVIYVYVSEIEKRNSGIVFLGIAFWAWAMTWEIGNGLVYYFSKFAPLWTAEKGNGSFLVYIGMNIEISFFVAIMGLLIIKLLPADPAVKILKIPSAIFITAIFGVTAVVVEYFLHSGGLISWNWYLWGNPHIWPIWLGYSFTWYLLALAHYHLSLKQKKLIMIFMLAAFIILHLIFAVWLKWV